MERLQPVYAEWAKGNFHAGLELLEPAHADPHVTQDQRRPRLPDDVEGARDRARHLAEVRPLHACESSARGSLKKLSGREAMGKVISAHSVSVDGYITGRSPGPGR